MAAALRFEHAALGRGEVGRARLLRREQQVGEAPAPRTLDVGERLGVAAVGAEKGDEVLVGKGLILHERGPLPRRVEVVAERFDRHDGRAEERLGSARLPAAPVRECFAELELPLEVAVLRTRAERGRPFESGDRFGVPPRFDERLRVHRREHVPLLRHPGL